MTDYFHVDRLGILQPSQIINLVKYSDIEPLYLQEHVDFLFPDGVTKHGDHYLLQQLAGQELSESKIEIIFEYIRRSGFPDRPSRYQSVFAFSTLAEAKCFLTTHTPPNGPIGKIWRVSAVDSFKADLLVC